MFQIFFLYLALIQCQLDALRVVVLLEEFQVCFFSVMLYTVLYTFKLVTPIIHF